MSANSSNEALVARRGQPDRVGPLRESAAGHARRRVVPETVARVGRDGDRNPEPGGLRRRLHPVVPLGQRSWPRPPVDVEVGQAELDETTRRDLGDRVGLVADRAVVRHDQTLMEELRGLLLERHSRHEVVDAILDRPARILVGVELAVVVQVAERHSVRGNAPASSGSDRRVRRARQSPHPVARMASNGDRQGIRPLGRGFDDHRRSAVARVEDRLRHVDDVGREARRRSVRRAPRRSP